MDGEMKQHWEAFQQRAKPFLDRPWPEQQMTDRALYGAMSSLFGGTAKVCFPNPSSRVHRDGGIKFNWRELTREGETAHKHRAVKAAAVHVLGTLKTAVETHAGEGDLPEIKKYTAYKDKQKHGDFYLFLTTPQQCIALADLIVAEYDVLVHGDAVAPAAKKAKTDIAPQHDAAASPAYANAEVSHSPAEKLAGSAQVEKRAAAEQTAVALKKTPEY